MPTPPAGAAASWGDLFCRRLYRMVLIALGIQKAVRSRLCSKMTTRGHTSLGRAVLLAWPCGPIVPSIYTARVVYAEGDGRRGALELKTSSVKAVFFSCRRLGRFLSENKGILIGGWGDSYRRLRRSLSEIEEILIGDLWRFLSEIGEILIGDLRRLLSEI